MKGLVEKAKRLAGALDGFALSIAAWLALLAAGIFVASYAIVTSMGWWPPALHTISDLRRGVSYRDEPISSAALLGEERLAIGTQGSGVHVYLKESGPLGLWRQYTAENTNGGLPGNNVAQIVTAGDKVWYVANGGLAVSDVELERWQSLIGTRGFRPLDVQHDISVIAFSRDQRYIGLGTYRYGVGVYDTKRHDWQALNTESGALFSDTINSLAFETGLLWIGTDMGVSVFELGIENPRDKMLWRRRADLELLGLNIRDVVVDDTRTWARSARGGLALLRGQLHNGRYQADGWQTVIGERGIPANATTLSEMTAVAMFNDRLWIGTRVSGIQSYDLKRHDWESYTVEKGLMSDAVTSLELHSDSLWAGTDQGLHRYDPGLNSWELVDATAGESIQKLKEYDGDLWYVAGRGDVGVHRGRIDEWQKVIGGGGFGDGMNEPILQTLVRYGSSLWFGSKNLGVDVYDLSNHSWSSRNLGLPEQNEASVVELKLFGNDLWARVEQQFGSTDSYHAVYRLAGQQWTQVTEDGIDVEAIEFDGRSVWFLTPQGWLIRHSDGANERYFVGTSIQMERLRAATRVGDTVYVASERQGLLYYDTRRHNWGQIEGLDSNIVDVESVDSGLFYVTGQGKLSHYNATSGVVSTAFGGERVEEIAQLSPRTVESFRDSVWIGTDDGFILKYDPRMHNLRRQDRGLGLPSADQIVVEELRRSGNRLWARTSERKDGHIRGQLYLYDESSTIWNRISGENQDVKQIASQGPYLWYLTDAGEIHEFKNGSYSGSYFVGSYRGFDDLLVAAADRHQRLWLGSSTHGVGVYEAATHNWQTFEISGPVNNILVVSLGGGEDYVFVGSPSGVYMFKSTDTGVTQVSHQLEDLSIVSLEEFAGSVWCLATAESDQTTQIIRAGLQGDSWQRVRDISEIDLDLDDIVAAYFTGKRLWVAIIDGDVAYYDPLIHTWRYAGQKGRLSSIQDLSEIGEMVVGNGLLWYRTLDQETYAYDPIRSETRHQVVFKGYPSFRRAYIRPLPMLAFLIVLVGGPIILFLSLRLLRGWFVCLLRFATRTRVWPTGGLLGLTKLALVIAVALPVIIAWRFLGNLHASQQQLALADFSDIRIHSLLARDDRIWIASSDGIWVFRYDRSKSEVQHIYRYSTQDGLLDNNVVKIVEDNGQIYARLFSGASQKLERRPFFLSDRWPAVEDFPSRDKDLILDSPPWLLYRDGSHTIVKTADQHGNYREAFFRTGKFDQERVLAMVPYSGGVLLATQDGVGRYDYDSAAGGLHLERFYTAEEGLVGPVRQMIVRDNRVYAATIDTVYMLDARRDLWTTYSPSSSAESPFNEPRIVFEDQTTGLEARVSAKGVVSLTPPFREKGEFSFDVARQMAVSDGRLWVRMDEGLWEATLRDQTPSLRLSRFTERPPPGEFERLFGGIVERTLQTFPEDPWRWQRIHDNRTGRDSVSIALREDGGIARPFDRVGGFADDYVQAVVIDWGPADIHRVWLATRGGIWLAFYEKAADSLRLERLYQAGSNVIALQELDGLVYARTSEGDLFAYTGTTDSWTRVIGFDPFAQDKIILRDENLGSVFSEVDGQVRLPQLIEMNGSNKFRFDHIEGIHGEPGNLWAGTRDGLLRYRVVEQGLELDQRYAAARGLTSVVLAIRVDAEGNLFSQGLSTAGEKFYKLSGQQWTAVSREQTPFSETWPILESAPGNVSWYRRGNLIYGNLDGQEVEFIDGKFDFDYVQDLTKTADHLWLATARGVHLYREAEDDLSLVSSLIGDLPDHNIERIAHSNGYIFVRLSTGEVFGLALDEAPYQRRWLRATDLHDQPYPFVERVAVLQDSGWMIRLEPESSGPLLQIPRLTGAQNIFDSSGKFTFDYVQHLASRGNTVWLATRGGIREYELREELRPGDWFTTRDNLPSNSIDQIAVTEGAVFVLIKGKTYRYQPGTSRFWEPASVQAGLFAPGKAVYSAGTWHHEKVRGSGDEPLVTAKGVEPNYQIFESSGKFAFDSIQGILLDGNLVWLTTKGGLVRARYQEQEDYLAVENLYTARSGLLSNDVLAIREDRSGIAWLLFRDGEGFQRYQVWQLDGGLLKQTTAAEGDNPFIFPVASFQFMNRQAKLVSNATGISLQLILDGSLWGEYYHVPDILLRYESLDGIIGLIDDGNMVWIATTHTLAALEKPLLERRLLRSYPIAQMSDPYDIFTSVRNSLTRLFYP